MPQYTFTSTPELIKVVDELAEKYVPKLSRSEMIALLVEIGIKEKTRPRRKDGNQKVHIPDNSADAR